MSLLSNEGKESSKISKACFEDLDVEDADIVVKAVVSSPEVVAKGMYFTSKLLN